LTLLRSKDYSAASTLLKELEQSRTKVDKRYMFGIYAYKQLNEMGIESEWLKWWALSPSLTQDEVYSDVGNVRKADSGMALRANKVSRYLKRCLDEASVKEDSEEKKREIIEKMIEFGMVLASQGHSRVVAEQLVFEVAMEGGLEKGVELWEACLGELRNQADQFKVEGDYLTRVSNRVQAEEAKLQESERREREETRLIERTTIMEDWYSSRSREAYKVVVRSRERIIRALANAGRVDEAVRLLLETRNYPSLLDSSLPLHLSKPLYLTILALLSTQDRFDLLQKVYTQFEEQESKLVRIRNKELRTRTPYWARGAMYGEGKERSPSAQEAFTTFRDQHKVSSIEEGSLDDMLEYSVATGEDNQHYGKTTSKRESDKLIKLVEEGQLDQALLKITKLLSHGPLPSAQSVATFIHSLSSHDNGQEVLKTIDEHVKKSSWRRGFWATCRMLQELQKGELRMVVRRFRDYFYSNSLPPPLPASIAITTSKVPSTRSKQSEQEEEDSPSSFARSVPNAYTLSIVMQALVPLLSDPLRTSGGTRHLSNIYQTLLTSSSSPSSFRIIPSHKPFAGGISSTRRRSPLDPYTFLPFMLLALKRRKGGKTAGGEQLELVGILRDMQGLGVRPQQPHLALLLSSYARNGDLEEFNYLLSFLVSPSNPSPSPPSISPELVGFVETHLATTSKKEETRWSPKLYATLLKSLRLRGAKEEGMQVLKGLMEKVGVDGLRGMLSTKEGERLRDEVGRLGRDD